MSYDVKEDIKNDSGSELTDDGNIIFTATRHWTIVDTELGQRATKVLADLKAAGLLPNDGNSHPDNGLLITKGATCTRESPFYFKAQAKYKSPPIPQGGGGGEDDIFSTDAKVKWRSVSGSSEVDEDFDGNAIVNPGTNEPVDGVMRDVTDHMAIITKNVPFYNPQNFQTYLENSNSDTFLGFSSGRGRLKSISADDAVIDGVDYFVQSAEVLFKTPYRSDPDKAWYHRRILKGFYELNAVQLALSNTVIERAVDDDKHPVTSPVLLDEVGLRVPAGDPGVVAETKLYGLVAYSGMGFF